ncbi:hypothetical protein K505DRAFT_320398 [Melanomma pulvis-pyrius CBS 109.77]|uniref:Ribosomal protein/NADH dehydrogenase domain-containing protein n=1 Tax=Melanomma pulvis-pyrius CBS 109.77 TaxID=1314802 RepID=A0A6A6XVN0_9PLEO|nr:hypothetical protein K505DRAFT_320398 [Melanomma pulvis-pyrius CBS 109.77]
MVHIVKRMRKLRELLWIRVGPGAIIFPKEVSKIRMEFSANIEGGHRGARKFWREMLPRIKYRNPALPIEISRHKDKLGPSILEVYTTVKAAAAAATPASTTPTPSAEAGAGATQDTLSASPEAPAHTIDLRMAQESEILAQLIARTGATVLKATAEEKEELAEIAEFKERSEKDRVEVREKLEAKRREEEMLRLARGEMVAAT